MAMAESRRRDCRLYPMRWRQSSKPRRGANEADAKEIVISPLEAAVRASPFAGTAFRVARVIGSCWDRTIAPCTPFGCATSPRRNSDAIACSRPVGLRDGLRLLFDRCDRAV